MTSVGHTQNCIKGIMRKASELHKSRGKCQLTGSDTEQWSCMRRGTGTDHHDDVEMEVEVGEVSG